MKNFNVLLCVCPEFSVADDDAIFAVATPYGWASACDVHRVSERREDDVCMGIIVVLPGPPIAHTLSSALLLRP